MYLVFDIGKTYTRLAVSQDGRKLEQIETTNTVTDFSKAMAEFKNIALKLTNGQKIKAAAGGVTTLDNRTKDKLVNHPTMPLWVGEPLKETLKKSLDTEVFLENDSAMAGLGETIFGAGKDRRIVAYITVSTGVGGVRIVDQRIDQNSLGFEPGHQIINSDSLGYLEEYISGSAIEKKYGKKPEQITDKLVWELVAKNLAIGLNNTIVYWSPDIVVLGGSVMENIPLDLVKQNLNSILKIFPQIPEVVKAGLGDEKGLLGSLAYLHQLK